MEELCEINKIGFNDPNANKNQSEFKDKKTKKALHTLIRSLCDKKRP